MVCKMNIQFEEAIVEEKQAKQRAGAQVTDRQSGIYRNYLKRVFDLAVVVSSGVIVLPLVAILALILAARGHSPFYISDRVGVGGRTFRMYKLKTMVEDADERLEAYLASNPKARAEWDRTQKLKRDPRVIWIGRWMRKTSLDELPQLWNVLTGDMSLVGPRPMMPSQRGIYDGDAYYNLRPGVTGIWQISDRNESGFEKRATLDTDYDGLLSFSVDIAILVRTVGAVARGTGY